MRFIVQYEGGGYDGCIWEWNFFYLENGNFQDIFSSGHFGISSKDELYKLKDSDKVYHYNIENSDTVEKMNATMNKLHLFGILKWLNNEFAGEHNFSVKCDICGRDFQNHEELLLEDWHGCGGIAVTADTIICNECHCSGCCEKCGRFVGMKNMGESFYHTLGKSDDDGYICTDCYCEQQQDYTKELREKLLHYSFITGHPDLHSPEMKWRWEEYQFNPIWAVEQLRLAEDILEQHETTTVV